MLQIPLQAVPNQIITPTLNNQSCKFKIYQKTTGMFIDIYVNDALVVGGVLA